jgi:peptidyl-prolyl isomerase E (cyclophilin E)
MQPVWADADKYQEEIAASEEEEEEEGDDPMAALEASVD